MQDELRELFQSKCHNCQNQFEIPELNIPPSWKGLHRLATDSDSIAVVCDHCKEAHSYNAAHFPYFGKTDKPSPYAEGGSSNLFYVTMRCDNKDCVIRATVLVPKKSKTSHEDVQKEIQAWNVSSLKCKCGGQIVIPNKAKPKFYDL